MRIKWPRVLVGGLVAELLVLAIWWPARAVLSESSLLTTVILASGIAPFVTTLWVGRRVESRFVLHGALVGLVAMLVSVAFATGQPQPASYQAAYGMNLLGGAVGGFISFRLRKPARR
jgi:putative membrane protein (TIGR04086 family)